MSKLRQTIRIVQLPRSTAVTLLARSVWLVVLVLAVIVFAAGLVAWYPLLRVICTDTQLACQQQQRLTSTETKALVEQGWSMESYALYNLTTRALQKLIGVTLGILIFWRQPVGVMSFVASLFLIIGLETSVAEVMALTYPSWWLTTRVLSYIGSLTFGLFFYLFPNGGFIPGWSRWTALFWAVIFIFPAFLPSSELNMNNMNPRIVAILVFGMMSSMLYAQAYRYRKVSTSIERVQTRWVVFVSTVSILIFLAALSTILLRGTLLQGRITSYWILIDLALQQFAILVPVAIAISVLRYRLWDIDVLIRRTMMYGTVTAILGAVYLSAVTLIQAIVSNASGQSSTFSIVLSTLAIAALFNPLRRRVQDFIDRRFYRQKYNAEQALAQFASLVNRETNLEKISQQVIRVAEETMQPEQASLWIIGHQSK